MLRRLLASALVVSLLGAGWVVPAAASTASAAHRCCRMRGGASHCATLVLSCCTTSPQAPRDSTPAPASTAASGSPTSLAPAPAGPLADLVPAARAQALLQHQWDQLKVPRDPVHLRNVVFLV
jgi:hypothetical protein